MNILFRYASQADLANIVGTYNSTIPSLNVTADLEPVTIQSKQAWFDAHNQTTRPLWLIEANGSYAGWMSFNSFYGRPAYEGTVELSIYLEENIRGKGLGKICLKKAIEEAPSRKIHTLLGFIFAHNEPSVVLFESFGFKKWAHFPEVANMNGTMRDLLIFGKKVQNG